MKFRTLRIAFSSLNILTRSIIRENIVKLKHYSSLTWHAHAFSHAALITGGCALAVQLIGLFVAVIMPFDNQGAVGKAFAALFAQMGAIPLAIAAIVLVIITRLLAGKFDRRTLLGLAFALGGLVPLSMYYVAVVRKKAKQGQY